MGFRVNMDDVGSGFEALPNGTYVVEIVGGEARAAGENAKNPGAWYGALEMDVKSPQEHEGRKFFTNFNIVPTALFTLQQLAVSCELDLDAISDDLPDFPGEEEGDVTGEAAKAFVEAVIEASLNKLVKVTNKQKPYEGEMRNNIKKIAPVTDEDAESLSLLP